MITCPASRHDIQNRDREAPGALRAGAGRSLGRGFAGPPGFQGDRRKIAGSQHLERMSRISWVAPAGWIR